MTVGQHPFIDIAVHGQIRERFAEGEALVLFAGDLNAVLWADGAGAELFGYDDVYAFMDDGAVGGAAGRRQLREAVSRLRDRGDEQKAVLRLCSGFRSRTVPVTLAGLRLADGTPAVLLSGGKAGGTSDPNERARRAIAGLGGSDTHVAMLDAGGSVLATSPRLSDLGIATDTLTALVADASGTRDRLVKRMIPTAHGRIPAALARLCDEPALYLLFAIETDMAAPEEPPHEAAVRTAQADDGGPGDKVDEPVAPATDEAGGEAAPLPEAADNGFVFDPKGRPVRFVWKIDTEGRFSAISADFAAAVGPNAADVVGRRFEDVAQVFGFDRDGAIAGLLRRHDTWSGRSVPWPVQGTALTVPVDLAALPTYTRDRVFDGFRGFGIVRVDDAAEDLEAIGLSLVTLPADVDPTTEPEQTVPTATPNVATETEGVAAETSTGLAQEDDPAAGTTDPDVPESVPDPFGGEAPALWVVPTPARRESDKVIDLELRRPRSREVLSSGEKAAFREIGKRLSDAFGKREPGARELAADIAGGSGAAGGEQAETAPQKDQHRKADEKAAAAAPDGPTVPSTPIEPSEQPARNVVALPSAFAVGQAKGAASGLDEDVLEDLPVALLVHSGETLHYANPEFLILTGYGSLDALQEAGGLGSLFASSDYAGTQPSGMPGTVRLIRADGEAMPVHARLQSITWHDGHALMLSLKRASESQSADTAPSAPMAETAPQDRTTDAQAPEAIRAAALQIEVEELRSILETATDGVVILGEHGDIRSMNRSASALFDYDEADTRGQPFAKLFAHESQRAVMDYLTGLSEHGVASVLNDGREVIGREASGGFIPLFMTIGRLSGSNGFCAVMRDITQWKRTEEELRAAKYAAEQASSHKSEFLARVSHEIRTPLNAIIGFADMMAEQRFGAIGSPRYLEYAHDIGRSGKHVLDIVNDLLDISKIEAGEMEVAFAAVALNDTVAEAVSLLQPQANSQRVIIRTSLSSSVPEIVADQRSIKQIALNLLANAIRFTPAGGQIVVSTAYEANGSVVLRIRDTGIGMSRSELEQAMKPFRQVRGTSRPRGDGTGLGLPLTKAMVEANRAQFEIRSAPQEGTLIEITFPPQRVLAD